MSDYTPSFKRDAPAAFDSADDYPDDFQYGSGLHHDDPWDGPESVGSDDGGTPSKREAFGEERHPSMALTWRDGDRVWHEDLRGFEVDRWEGENGVQYTITADGVADGDETLCDADARMLYVRGTREGDTSIKNVSVLSAEDDTVVIETEPSEAGEIGALYRWMATGCLLCRDRQCSCGGGSA